jgi:hypothetical protein
MIEIVCQDVQCVTDEDGETFCTAMVTEEEITSVYRLLQEKAAYEANTNRLLQRTAREPQGGKEQ